MLNGKPADISDFEADELAAAVLISLFSWRKSNPDDGVKAPTRQGWWGDTFAEAAGDRIGSRLWLLQRQKVFSTTLRRAEAYAKESLQWLIDDAVVATLRFLRSARGLTRSRCGLPAIGLMTRRRFRRDSRMFGSENVF